MKNLEEYSITGSFEVKGEGKTEMTVASDIHVFGKAVKEVTILISFLVSICTNCILLRCVRGITAVFYAEDSKLIMLREVSTPFLFLCLSFSLWFIVFNCRNVDGTRGSSEDYQSH